jgi:hypothetical protein
MSTPTLRQTAYLRTPNSDDTLMRVSAVRACEIGLTPYFFIIFPAQVVRST